MDIKVGDRVRILGDEETNIVKIEYDNWYRDKKYWFRDKNDRLWFVFKEDIEEIELICRDLNMEYNGLSREVNQLRITNLKEYLNSGWNNSDYYKGQFKILSELEDKIMYENKPEKTINIEYKYGGVYIFELVNIVEENGMRVVIYEFSGTAS